jgi:hypothetical protein
MTKLLSQLPSHLSPKCERSSTFFPRVAKEVGKKLERSFSFIFNNLFLKYTFFHIYKNNKDKRNGKCLKNKGMVFYPGGGGGEPWERRERSGGRGDEEGEGHTLTWGSRNGGY